MKKKKVKKKKKKKKKKKNERCRERSTDELTNPIRLNTSEVVNESESKSEK